MKLLRLSATPRCRRRDVVPFFFNNFPVFNTSSAHSMTPNLDRSTSGAHRSASLHFLQLLDLCHGRGWQPSNLRWICGTTPEQAVRNVVEEYVSCRAESRLALAAAQPNARTRAFQHCHDVDEVHDVHVVLRPVQMDTTLLPKVISVPLCGWLHQTRSQPRLRALSHEFGQPQSGEKGIRAPTLRTSSDPP